MRLFHNSSIKYKAALQYTAVFCLPILLAALYFSTHPFKDCLLSRHFSLRQLNSSQRSNIEISAAKLNGLVLKPGEVFSFNKAVGPRLDRRGYKAAASYLGSKSPATVGGGICLISSGLYQAALAAGLEILERSPHMRTVGSVEPGLDATVWYGQFDLRFKNNSGMPLQFKLDCRDGNLSIALYGQKERLALPVQELKTVVAARNKSELMIETFKCLPGKRTFISRDFYKIN